MARFTGLPAARETMLDVVPGLHTSIVELSGQQQTSWREHSAVAITVLCMKGDLRVDIDKPMFSTILGPGEMYTIPANVVYRIGAMDAGTKFLLVQAGLPWDMTEATVARGERDEFLRTLSAPEPLATPVAPDTAFDQYSPGYTRVDVVAKTQSLRLLILGLGEFRCVPWHTHDEIRDTFFCIEGPMRVETDHPRQTHVLLPGDTCDVDARQPHFVAGTQGNPCIFLVMQGIGLYNYVPATPAS